MGRVVVLVAMVVALLAAPRVNATDPALTWSAPAECPGSASADAQLQARLRGASAPGTRAKVEIVATPDGYSATITVSAAEPFAPRTLAAGDCEALTRAAVLVIAVAIDPVAVAAVPPPIDPLEPIPPPPAPTAPLPLLDRRPPTATGVAAPPPVASPGPRVPWHHAVRIAGGVGSQIAPVIAGAVQLGWAAIAPRWRVEAALGWIPPVRRRYADGAGARVQAVLVEARACPAPRLGPVTLPVCVGVAGGPVIGSGTGVPEHTRSASGWLAAQLGVAAVVELRPRIGLLLGADGFVALVRPAFHLGARRELLRTPLLGGRGLVGLEIRLR